MPYLRRPIYSENVIAIPTAPNILRKCNANKIFLQFALVTLLAQQMKSVTDWMEDVFAQMETTVTNANLVSKEFKLFSNHLN